MSPAKRNYLLFATVALLGAASMPTNAKTVTIDSSSASKKLSVAVADAYAAEDDADIIEIHIDQLEMDTTEIMLNKPITINGDADGNGTKADILVDIPTIKSAATVGEAARCYIEIESPGDVIINDLKIHPNFDNVVAAGNEFDVELVDAIRMNRHVDQTTTPTHQLNRLWISGSDANDNYIPLDNKNDLYNMAGVKRWSRKASDASRGIIQISKNSTFGTGNFNAVLTDCHVGLGQGEALNIPAEDGNVTINSGLFGHSGNNGIRVSGDTISLIGTRLNRMRIVNVPNINASNSHGIFSATGTFATIEYVDIATINTGRNMQIDGGITVPMKHCRLMGKYTPTQNAPLFFTDNNSDMTAEGITVVGSGTNVSGINPMEFPAGLNNNGNSFFTDCVFTSENLGYINNKNTDATGKLTFTNCALPTDGGTSESLRTSSAVQEPVGIDNVTITGGVTVSPQYMLTRNDYDWSEAQGHGKPGNGQGNVNVYRPSNPAYAAAATGGAPLVGGAGQLPAGIAFEQWMLME